MSKSLWSSYSTLVQWHRSWYMFFLLWAYLREDKKPQGIWTRALHGIPIPSFNKPSETKLFSDVPKNLFIRLLRSWITALLMINVVNCFFSNEEKYDDTIFWLDVSFIFFPHHETFRLSSGTHEWINCADLCHCQDASYPAQEMKGQGIYGSALRLSLKANDPFITKKHTKTWLRFKAQACCVQAQVSTQQAVGSWI